MNKLKLVGLAIILGLSTVNTNAFNGDYPALVTNLSEEEAIQIAMNNEEVGIWLNDSSGNWYDTWFENNFWYIIFKSTTLNRYLHVIINDSTEEITGINYPQTSTASGPWYYYESQTLRDQASDYFKAQSETTVFTDFNLNVWPTGLANYIEISGWRPSSEKDDSFNSWMRFNQTSTGEFEFALLSLSSTIGFGEANNSMNDAMAIASDSSYVNDFYGNFSVNEIEISQWMIFENFAPGYQFMVTQLQKGTYFEIQYRSWEWTEDNTVKTIGEPIFDHNVDFDMHSYYDNWLGLIISDETGSIISTFGTVFRQLNNENVLDILLADPEFVDWFSEIDYVNLNINYNGEGLIWVDVRTNRLNEWAYIQINDQTSEILFKDIQKSIPATKTSDDILSIALSDFDISNFVLNVNEYRVNFNYDFRGQWYIEFFDPIVVESYGNIAINDSDGFIFWSDAYVASQPKLSQAEVIDIALSTDLFAFYDEFPDVQISMFYGWENAWQVYVYSPVYYDANIEIIISDITGNVLSTNDNSYIRLPDNSKEEIREVMVDDDLFKEFIEGKAITYETIFFMNSNWYTYVEAIDNDGVSYMYESEISIYLGTNWSDYRADKYGEIRNPRADEMVWGFEDWWGARYLGKQIKTPLADVIGDYTLPSPTSQPGPDPTQSPSLDLNGFSLIPSLIAVMVMIPIYLKRKR